MKRITLILAAALLAASCANQPDIKVMSFNVRYGVAQDGENSWDFRKDAAVAMLQDQAPDFFGVQEAFDYQRDYFLEALPQYAAIGCGRDDGSDKGEHMCIFYNTGRFQLLDGGNFWLSETPDVPSKGWDAMLPRVATWAFLQDNKSNRKFYYINTHLDHVGVEARKNALPLIQQKIASINPTGKFPMIVTGDFNLQDGDPTIEYFNGIMNNARNVAEVSDRHITYNAWGDVPAQGIIDYIYFSGFKKCFEYHTVVEPYLGRDLVSDHHPIYATLAY